MAFFCAGSSNDIKKHVKKGSKPVSGSKTSSSTVVSSNGRVVNPFQNTPKPQPPGPVTVPHSNSDLNSRKMVVLQEYRPTDSQGLAAKRGEIVQVIKEEINWYYVRNERHKEGYVPSNHLVAPYSSMRSRNRVLGVPNPPLRHVTSNGSSIDMKEASQHPAIVPMYPSTSAGRPRNYSMGDDNRINSGPHRRSYSPHEGNSNSLSQGQSAVTAYEQQKYSPSTSSGVASFTGTASPVGQSDGSHHSSYCSIEEDRMAREGGGGADEFVDPLQHNGHGRSHPSYVVEPPPHHHHHPKPAFSGHIPSTEAPPPLPPRTFYNPQPPPLHSASQGDPYLEDLQGESDSYASPADAIPRQQSPHLGHPRIRSLNDIRLREIKRSQENGVYSEVFQGHQRPPRQNGFRMTEDDNNSEGGSSRSRSSRKSSSRVSSLQTQTTTEPYAYYDCEVFSHESSDVTPNEGSGHGRRPLSANSINKAGQTRIKKFRKNLWGVYIVVQPFEAQDENEVSVREGDHVSVWNQDDRDWYWIVKHDTSSEEGFVPSSYLKELNPDSQSQMQTEPKPGYSMEDPEEEEEDELDIPPPPPLPPKPPQAAPHGHHPPRRPPQSRVLNSSAYDNHTNFRQRATSHDSRPSPSTRRGVASGNTGGFRGRIGSDGSSSGPSSGGARGAPSTTSTDKRERSLSPPNTPPPPYTEFDSSYNHHHHHHRKAPLPPPTSNGGRHFSLSQQAELPPGAYGPTHMQRTHSHGQVPYRRVNMHRVATTPAGGTGEAIIGGQRSNKPPVASPTEIDDGGTLV